RVIPDERAYLIDDLLEVDRTPERRERVMHAELSDRELAFVEGTLAEERDPSARDGYRGVGRKWTLRASGARMLCCTHPLDAPHMHHVRFWAPLAALAFVFAGGFHLVASLWMWPLLDDPACVEAEIAELRHYTTRSRRSGVTHHYRVDANVVGPCDRGAAPDAVVDAAVRERRELSDEAPYATWAALYEGERVPFVIARRSPELYELGRRPGARDKTPFKVAVVAVVLLIIAATIRYRRRPWYESSKVVHRGSGPL
nr:hypothetical protein [Myxococcota bacterium]